MASADLTAARLRELLDYAPETGVFTRALSVSGVKAGAIAGARHGNGYTQISVDGRLYLAHRLAWLHVHGRWPAADLDHINGVRDDNRLANLREASPSENMQNQRTGRGVSGCLGVSWYKRDSKWKAQIQVNGRTIHLGYFTTKDRAQAAYAEAKREHHPFGTI